MSTELLEVPNVKRHGNMLIPDTNDLSFYGTYSTNMTKKLYAAGENLLANKYIEKIKNKTTVMDETIPEIAVKLKNAVANIKTQHTQHTTNTPNIINPKSISEAPKLYNAQGNIIGEEPQIIKPQLITDANIIQNTQAKLKQLVDYNPNESVMQKIMSQHVEETRFNIKKSNHQNYALELLKCRMSSLYFIENYVSVPVTGGRVSMKESEQWNMTDKYKIIISLFQQYDLVLYMSSRQSGKTTTSAMYLLWCMIFFPKIQISYLTLDKTRAIDMISRMKEMMDSLPKWMQVKPKSNAERLSYYELSNGSKISASFVSGSNDPDRVGRGLTSPIIFIDETAFIPHAKVVWGAVQPVYSAAKIHAKRNGYPYGVIFTSTPNGAGDNFFYKVYQNSIKFDDIYDYENKRLYDDYKKQFELQGKNDFISVILHWSEFRTQEWYETQKKELNYDIKKINQELDLAFLGSDTCIFSDEVISRLYSKKRVDRVKMIFNHEFDLFTTLDPKKRYILGVDTAMSTGSTSDYSAIILTDAETGDPIGEWKGRFSVVKRYAQMVKSLIKSLKTWYGLSPRSLIVAVERNSIGKEVVEELVYDESDFDYEEYLFSEIIDGEKVFGIYTSNSGRMGQGKRDIMFQLLMTHVNERPTTIHGKLLIDELRNLEQKSNGKIEASKGQHDDVVMAWNFCLYSRKVLVDRGEIFIPGLTRNSSRTAIESNIISSVMSTGSTISLGKPQVIHVNTKAIDKLSGISKVEIKQREETKRNIAQEMNQLSQIMPNVFVGSEPEEEKQERFSFSDYIIM